MRGNEDRLFDLPRLSRHPRWRFHFMVPVGMDLLFHTWRRSPRGPYFSLLVQRKVGKRNTPGGPPAAARRVRSPGGNFRTGHPAPAENGAHPCAPPCGFYPPGLPDLRGPKSKRARDLHVLLLAPSGPMRHGEWAGSNPKGAAPDGRRFRMAQGCALRKFPDRPRTRSAQRGGRAAWGVLSLVTFFAQAKKVTPPRPAAPCLGQAVYSARP
ncbi:hypothetical protein J2S80_000903 [Pseudoxanthomonas mexicana]|nr:hypothetical protein [Pseudoxanthomonas mexicana]